MSVVGPFIFLVRFSSDRSGSLALGLLVSRLNSLAK